MPVPHSENPTEESVWNRRLRFQRLMSRRVQDILLVTSLYDSFILAEDGELGEQVLSEFLDLNLRHSPELTHVPTGAEALAAATGGRRYDLVISSFQLGDMTVLDLIRDLRAAGVATPVIVLAYDAHELADFAARNDVSAIERIFLWQGDVKVLLAIVKYLEDRLNLEHDTGEAGIPAIVVVEDNVRYYSSFLPVLYTELMSHAHSLMPEGLNRAHKLTRIRARPKILLSQTYEEAWGFISQYPDEILGVISDIEFPRDGQLDRFAGAELARQVRALHGDIPIMLQSAWVANEDLARQTGAYFLLKDSPVLLQQLREFMAYGFGFGDFVFRLPDGTEVERARDLQEMVEKLETVPGESLAYHASGNHFSRWLKTRTEFTLAEQLRPRRLSDFSGIEGLRRHLIESINEYRLQQNRGVVVDFARDRFDRTVAFSRIGSGSMGGKGRGLAFVNSLIQDHGARRRFPGVVIGVPPAIVLGTDVFDEFLERNTLRDFAIECESDREIRRRFRAARLPRSIERDLAAFLQHFPEPLAVRSSSLLEDNQYQPFAGIYETLMLPNDHPVASVRLGRLVAAIKRVYASTFSAHSKAYLETTPYRLEEEKMAVIVQRMVGTRHGDLFYPDFAGVARSHDFYPPPGCHSSDGFVAVALGLGRTVVDGERCLRFCPRAPLHTTQPASVREMLDGSQREFWALHLGGRRGRSGDATRLVRVGLEQAERDGVLQTVGSTYSAENDAVYDGLARAGVRLVSFAPVLKHGLFPLADVISYLLQIGERGTSTPVEIEFAVNLDRPSEEPAEFGFLQMRPLALSREVEALEIGEVRPEDVVVESPRVLGHGRLEDIRDVVVIDYHRFDRSRTREAAGDVARFNAELRMVGVPYVLIGVGRWGSTDPWLGIPIRWDEIAGAGVIVESGFRDLRVAPSQGTHFFQNLTTSRVGYFTVNQDLGEGSVAWEWLAAQPALRETPTVRHLRFEKPLVIAMNGRTNEGVILKPGTLLRNGGESANEV